jgi:DNA polymerase III subunit epsilon
MICAILSEEKTMRQVVLDTETTGLDPKNGHRIIEIGCVELFNRQITGQTFHFYLQPDRDIDPDAMKVHGITNEFLVDKPRFSDIVTQFLKFVENAELIIHNAPFDVGFLNAELKLWNAEQLPIDKTNQILDTLVLARRWYPGQKNNLDALCKRFNIDNTQRQLHGALLDAQILAEVYLAMTGGQVVLLAQPDSAQHIKNTEIRRIDKNRSRLPVIMPTTEELALHEQRLATIEKKSGGQCVWLQQNAQQVH